MIATKLDIVSKKVYHFGRSTGPAQTDMEGVSIIDQRNVGNWTLCVFHRAYSTKVPLGALWDVADFDKKRSLRRNSRLTFK